MLLAAACGSHDVLHAGATYFLIVATVIVGRSRNPLRMLFAPLLLTLGVLDGDVGRCLLTTAQGRLPAAWGSMKFDHLIASGVLGGDAAQLLSGVPENVVWCLEGRRLLCVMHAASERQHP
jgi:hypothetical protein